MKVLDPSRIYDINNGITLCNFCHNKLVTGKEVIWESFFEASVASGQTIPPAIYNWFCDLILHPPQMCECGCGQWTVMIRGRPNRYILGHHTRGRKWTEATREKLAAAHQAQWGDDRIAVAQRLYDKPMSTKRVAEIMGVSQAWVHKSVKTRGHGEAQRLRFAGATATAPR